MIKKITGGLRRRLQLLRNRFRPISLILMYHRVAEVNADPWQLCVAPRHFSEHLEVLQKYACLLRLDQLVQNLQKGKIPGMSVVITFDDGYADNLHTAKPLLEQFGIPATFFLSTGCIKQHREFWWDELDRLILQPVMLPDALQLTIQGKKHAWHLDGDISYNENIMQKNASWRAWEEAPTRRHNIYYSLWQLLKPLEDNERQSVLDTLQAWAGAVPHVRSTHRPLRPEEISVLSKGGLVEIGAHSVNHVALSSHSLSQQHIEINQSKKYLENILGNHITSFSYPYGDYSGETIELVKKSGYSCACTTSPSAITTHTDPFHLPRLGVLDWDGQRFENQLLQWFANKQI